MVKVSITQVLTRKLNDETSYIACAKTKEGGQLLRFIGTGTSPFSEYASYNVDYNDDSVQELHPNKIFVNSSTIIEQCENTSNLSKLVDARTAENNERLSTVKSVVVSCEEVQEVEGGGKRRKLRVADESVNYPMNVMAFKEAAEEGWVPGDVIIIHRAKVYAPEGTDYRAISIYDKPTKSGNDKESDDLQELYKIKFAEKEYKEVDSIDKLSTMSESLDYVQVEGIVVKVDVLTPQQQEGREGKKFQSIYIADTSNKYINCVCFNESLNDSIVCDQAVKVKLTYSVNGKRKNFVVKQMEAVKNKELENWWATMMWMDLLPVFEMDARDETSIKDISTNCKNWSGERKRVSVRGKLVRNDHGVLLREGDHEITIKEVNCELPESGANVLVENAPVNEFGIVVFANTKVTRCV